MKKNLIVLFLAFLSTVLFADSIIYKPTPSSIKFIGEPNSPIEITLFLSSNCPSCKKTAIMFYEMTNSVYKGKIKVSVKPLYKQLGDIALIAADNQNKSWELLKAYSNTNQRIDAENINALFTEAEINENRIYEDMRDTTLIFSILDANYAESKKCGMNWTPHIIINGKIYEGELTPKSVTDYIEQLLLCVAKTK